jgi:RimJ/RimL family protein N-acetyltransferase
MYYPVSGKDILLDPLFKEESLLQLEELCNKKNFLLNSRVLTSELNLSDSSLWLKKQLSLSGYWFYNRLYLIIDKKESIPCGITGLKNIDWIERRAEIVLIMDDASEKKKVSYEPLKLLLKKIVYEWHLRRVWLKVFTKHQSTITVLKGFGFSREGILREEIYVDGEYIDIEIFGLLDREFHCVDEE